MRRWTMVWLAMLMIGVGLPPQSAQAAQGDVEWTRTFGVGRGVVYAVATHSRGVYAVGSDDIGNAFVRSYTTGGKLRWSRSFNLGVYTSLDDVAVNDSGVYVAGIVYQEPDDDGCSSLDGIVRKYTHQGALRWTRFVASNRCTNDGPNEVADGIAVDSKGVYVVGYTNGAFPGQRSAGDYDIFLRKYTTAGRVVWTRQSGTPGSDGALSVALDPWGVLVAGDTTGAWPGETNRGDNDAFVRKYSRTGGVYWTRQIGTSSDDSDASIASDGASFYVGGGTLGAFPGQTRKGGYSDGWVRKYQGDGTPKWTRQFGTSDIDSGVGLGAGADRVYLTGFTYGSFAGYTNMGGSDVFVTNYSSAGVRGWTRQFGAAGYDFGRGIALGPRPSDSQQDDRRGLYVGGGLDSRGDGVTKAFVRKYEE